MEVAFMWNPKRLVLTLTAVVLFVPGSFAQSAAFKFKSGEWRIDSTVTTSGRAVSIRQRVCANDTSELWKQPHPNQQCDPASVTAAAGGIRVQLSCHGASGPVAWKLESDVTEIFSGDGASFTATGSTTTTTSYPGGNPISATGSIRSQGMYQGTCTAKH